MPSPAPQEARRKFKPLALAKSSNTPLLGRTNLVAAMQSVVAKSVPPPTTSNFPLMAAFESGNLWPWITNYLKTSFTGKFKPYPTYPSDGTSGVYQMKANDGGDVIRVSIVGDWGTGTYESWKVAQCMADSAPDYMIHLGDVYYVGDQQEVDENFLGTPGGQYTPVQFPKGSVGTLALIGNHEMYGGGGPYFSSMLPYCETGTGISQQAGFFCLETPQWRIIGIDTGYNSVGTFILGSIPIIKKIPWFGANCALQSELLTWLQANVNPQQNKKPTMLLSHHQYFSAYSDEAFGEPAKQLKGFFAGQEVVWIWGHEHRLSIYNKFSPDGNITCYGRCLGNGGMPVEEGTGYTTKAPLMFFDPRYNYPVGDNTSAGYNGFMNLTIDGATLALDYRDLNNTQLFQESFVGNPDGSLQYSFTNPVPILQPA
jgi:predicted phosphodiesterase